jgi:peroxiredoxin
MAAPSYITGSETDDTDTSPSARAKGSHLTAGVKLPPVTLPSTSGYAVDLTRLPPRCILILYPLALAQDQAPPSAWTRIPWATACTQQLLGFNSHYREFRARRVDLFGISTQSSIVQLAVAENLALRFPLLSDGSSVLARALRLPMLQVGRRQRLPRIVLAVRDGHIDRVVYPSTSPSSVTEVLREWAGILAARSDGSPVYSCDSQIGRD